MGSCSTASDKDRSAQYPDKRINSCHLDNAGLPQRPRLSEPSRQGSCRIHLDPAAALLALNLNPIEGRLWAVLHQ